MSEGKDHFDDPFWHAKSHDFLWNIRYTPRLAMVYSEYSTGNHMTFSAIGSIHP